jgi:transposase-like protein
MSLEVPFDEKTLREVLIGDKGAEVLLETVMNEILQSEMTQHLRAEPGEQTDDRREYRNGTYQRKLTTRVGTIELEVPRDREGTFQTALFQRYQRSEKALVLALMQMVVQGVSTRRVKEINTELCGRQFSKWASRSLEEQSYPILVLDAMHLKVRRQGAVRSTTVMLAVGINEADQREIPGLLWRPLERQPKGGAGLSGDSSAEASLALR